MQRSVQVYCTLLHTLTAVYAFLRRAVNSFCQLPSRTRQSGGERPAGVVPRNERAADDGYFCSECGGRARYEGLDTFRDQRPPHLLKRKKDSREETQREMNKTTDEGERDSYFDILARIDWLNGGQQ